MYKIIVGFIILFSSVFSSSIKTDAYTQNPFPVVQESDHWMVTIKESADKKTAKQGLFDVYGVSVENKGNMAYNVHVDVYKKEPKNNTKIGFFSLDSYKVGHNPLEHSGYPMSEKTNEVTVIITWLDQQTMINRVDVKKGNLKVSRKYMQQFTFKK